MNISSQTKLYYLVEKGNWSIFWDGYYITRNLAAYRKQLKSKIAYHPKRKRNAIIHFGSRNLALPQGYLKSHPSNHLIVTWFHGTNADAAYNQSIPQAAEKAVWVHTSCEISRQHLITLGVPEKKIIKIPLGIDNTLFQPISAEARNKLRKQLGIPQDKLIMGSFQKDGVGWQEGLEPKWVKGPDVFCDVIEKLNEKQPVFALLTGPARGYVKKRLTQAGIPFKHVFLPDYKKIAQYYPALDVYLITSRAEGGPKALLEAMAAGVPVVTTEVGMAPEVIRNGNNGFIAPIDDINELLINTEHLIKDENLRKNIIQQGLQTVKDYSWENIAEQYYEKLYEPILKTRKH